MTTKIRALRENALCHVLCTIEAKQSPPAIACLNKRKRETMAFLVCRTLVETQLKKREHGARPSSTRDLNTSNHYACYTPASAVA